jgi:hypothetical protein
VTAVLQRVDVAVSPDVSASRPLLPIVVRWAVYVLGITALTCYLVVVITSLHNRWASTMSMAHGSIWRKRQDGDSCPRR